MAPIRVTVTGAAGNIGARQVARAAPDGYTWIYSAGPMAANVRMYKSPGYDVMKAACEKLGIEILDTSVFSDKDTDLTA